MSSEMKKEARILCVANSSKEAGTGHLVRTAKLLTKLGSQAFIYLNHQEKNTLAIAKQFDIPEERISHDPQTEGPWDLIVLDNYQTSVQEAQSWMALGRVVALDEGGEARGYIPYLIDTLPTLPSSGEPNESETGYLCLPMFSGLRQDPPQRILVTFGGVDEAQLTEKVGLMLDNFSLPPHRWTVSKGTFFARTFAWPGIKILDNPDIEKILPEFDLVITHFGLTAFEAAASGANVVLLNPTPYHEKLSKVAGFPSLGMGDINKKLEPDFHNYLLGQPTKQSWKHHVIISAEKDLAKKLLSLIIDIEGGCPCCPSEKNRFGSVVFRNVEKSYAICPTCGLTYQEPFKKVEIEYDEKYFFKEYEEQYGRTYLDDFDHIYHMGLPRIKRILSKLKTGEKNLLEIGCAYGAFLKAAHEYGFNTRGIEINKEAVDYVSSQLQIPVTQTNFPYEFSNSEMKFDVIAMWYVLEHFKNVDAALSRVSQLIKPGGIFAFSTPLGDGMTATYYPKKFFKESPDDHYSIFTRKNIAKILLKYGFKVVHIEITGVHPERKDIKMLPGKKFYKLHQARYKKKSMGDTFEVYAIKKDM